MVNLNIVYVIPLQEANKFRFSPLQGFQFEILKTVSFFYSILQLPHHLLEFQLTRDELILDRICGAESFQIIPIQESLLKDFLAAADINPFICVFSDQDTYHFVDKLLMQTRHPVLHISTNKHRSAINIEHFDRRILLSYIRKVINHLEIVPQEKLFLKKLVSTPKKIKEKLLSLKGRDHFSTLPNEMSLLSLGYKLQPSEKIKPGSNQAYIRAIVDSADVIKAERIRVLSKFKKRRSFPPGLDLIVTVPSMYRDVYQNKSAFKKMFGASNNKITSQLFNLYKSQTSYSFSLEEEKMKKLYFSKQASAFHALASQEKRAYSIGVAVKASNNFAPTLRLPPAVNKLHGYLKALGDCERGSSARRSSKRARMLKTIMQKLLALVAPEFISAIDKDYSHIKLMCDSPLEWLPIRGIPLMLRYNLSKIPSTPGNLFFQQSIQCTQRMLSIEDFREVLIIRSFSQGDPLRFILQESIKTFMESMVQEGGGQDIQVRWVDVHDENDFIQALNSFSGSLMIFDGHGTHDKSSDISFLCIGSLKLDIWQLKDKVRVPPIVLLSACDTHPIDGSHASTVNGFLSLGAITVLGTVLPVAVMESSIFLARLIYRIHYFLDQIETARWAPLRWTTIISGLQRKSFVSEFLHYMDKVHFKIAKVQYEKISIDIGLVVESTDRNWFEMMLEMIAKETGQPLVKIKTIYEGWEGFPECFKYIQYGNPELLLLVPTGFRELSNCETQEHTT